MGKLIYITGGARSGKSNFAERMAAQLGDITYIATAVPFDEEMKDRIRRHQEQRPPHWKTVEQYRGIGGVLRNLRGSALLDCLTIMITNLMMDAQIDWDHPTVEQIDAAERRITAEVEEILAGATSREGSLIVVSNELGMGLVPAYAFGRAFRDIAGRMNQRVARAADEAWFLVSGVPMRLK